MTKRVISLLMACALVLAMNVPVAIAYADSSCCPPALPSCCVQYVDVMPLDLCPAGTCWGSCWLRCPNG
ncbi:MAG: hypothetical protein FWB71_05785, partial [Defluviitaleaceae bacterium]|nr:hypothetical protein [Defluviitaleaceae bacterium]